MTINSESPDLLSREEYDHLSPVEQGYASYMQAEWPGSRLPKTNPYPPDSREHAAWTKGQTRAAMHAQDDT